MGKGSIPRIPYESPIAIPPGATIKEFMEAAGMTQTELAHRMNRPIQTINELIKGKKRIVEDTAVQLEKVLGSPADFWLTLERNYQLTKARLSEKAKLSEQLERTRKFPYPEMVKLDLVTETRNTHERMEHILRFLRVASYDALDRYFEKVILAYRRSPQFELSLEKLAVWLRMGELRSENLNLSIYDEGKLRENLPEIRSLTLVPVKEIIPRLVKIGEQCGVAFLFVRELTGFPVHGLVRWVGDHPFIQVGLRYKRHDILWFTIFHEIGHILLHGRREIFIESKKAVGKNRYEDKADKFAEDILIPPEVWNNLIEIKPLTSEIITDTAEEIGIASGIIVGRLRKYSIIPQYAFQDMIIPLEWNNP